MTMLVPKSRRDAFLREIAANPDDSTTRLVFADWLDENGEPETGEYIRLRCEYRRFVREVDAAFLACQRRKWESLSPYEAEKRNTTCEDAVCTVCVLRRRLVELEECGLTWFCGEQYEY